MPLQMLLRLPLQQHNQSSNRAAAQALPTQACAPAQMRALLRGVLHPPKSVRGSSRLHKQRRARYSRSRQARSGHVQVRNQVLLSIACAGCRFEVRTFVSQHCNDQHPGDLFCAW
jgi:hypothetical protein